MEEELASQPDAWILALERNTKGPAAIPEDSRPVFLIGGSR
ncbi:hypothetical protein [Arthrobacter sp. 2MCAF14]